MMVCCVSFTIPTKAMHVRLNQVQAERSLEWMMSSWGRTDAADTVHGLFALIERPHTDRDLDILRHEHRMTTDDSPLAQSKRFECSDDDDHPPAKNNVFRAKPHHETA